MGLALSRPATPSDWDAAARLLAEHRRWVADALDLDLTSAQPAAGGEFTTPAHFYRPPDGVLVMATTGTHPIGMVGVHRHAGTVGELKRMYVRPAGRGRGVGRALVATAVAAAAELGFTELWLQTEPETMAAAHRLYREAGFVDIPPYHDLGVAGVATLGLRLRASPRPRFALFDQRDETVACEPVEPDHTRGGRRAPEVAQALPGQPR